MSTPDTRREVDPLPGGAFSLGHGHFMAWLEDGDLIWKDPNCASWNHVDVTSGERHRLMKGGKSAPPVVLKIEGSLLCRGCGAHGFVVDGRWVES